MRSALALAALSLALLACEGTTSNQHGGSGGAPGGGSGGGGSGGSGGSGGDGGSGGSGGGGGSGTASCSAPHADQIILVDDTDHLVAFDPRKIGAERFELLAALSCPASETPAPGFPGTVVPYALTVDRQGVVWLLYTSGEIFQVSLRDASRCVATSFVPGRVGTLVSLGFSSDVAGGDAETLFSVTGDPGSKGGQLGRIDTTALTGTNIGALPRSGSFAPWIAGDRGARLFLMAPGIVAGAIQQVDKTSAQAIGTSRTLAALDPDTFAWAFATWGGKHYVFQSVNVARPRTSVTTLDRETGESTVVIADAGSNFLTAGVSTCAPDAP